MARTLMHTRIRRREAEARLWARPMTREGRSPHKALHWQPARRWICRLFARQPKVQTMFRALQLQGSVAAPLDNAERAAGAAVAPLQRRALRMVWIRTTMPLSRRLAGAGNRNP